MTLPPLRLLTVFDTVIRRGGVRLASAELNVSQPAISQSLRQLEEHLGARLLDRAVRPAALTEAGRLLHRATVEGLGRIAEAVDEIGRLGARTDNAATIACSVGFATYWLMPRLAGFYDRHPDMAINVMTTQHGAPPLSPGVDIAIRYGDGAWTDGHVQLLFPERIDPVCSPELAARLGAVGGGIADASLLHVDVEDDSWVRWGRYLRAAGLPANQKAGLHFTNYVQATQAALGGLGIMLGWRSITSDLVREGRLVTFLDAPVMPPDGFYLVTSPRRRPAATCQAIGAWLVAAAGAAAGGWVSRTPYEKLQAGECAIFSRCWTGLPIRARGPFLLDRPPRGVFNAPKAAAGLSSPPRTSHGPRRFRADRRCRQGRSA